MSLSSNFLTISVWSKTHKYATRYSQEREYNAQCPAAGEKGDDGKRQPGTALRDELDSCRERAFALKTVRLADGMLEDWNASEPAMESRARIGKSPQRDEDEDCCRQARNPYSQNTKARTHKP